jgi:hypothetical protein
MTQAALIGQTFAMLSGVGFRGSLIIGLDQELTYQTEAQKPVDRADIPWHCRYCKSGPPWGFYVLMSLMIPLYSGLEYTRCLRFGERRIIWRHFFRPVARKNHGGPGPSRKSKFGKWLLIGMK